METQVRNTARKPHSIVILTAIIIACLLAGGVAGYALSNLTTPKQVSNLQDQVSALQQQVLSLQSSQDTASDPTTTENNTTYFFVQYNISLSQLYEQVKTSVVVIEGTIAQEYTNPWGQPYYVYSTVQGSGFIYNSTGHIVIVTNYHVVDGATNITVTFIDGDSYPAKVIGSDPYADLALLTSNASQDEYQPIMVTSSSTLSVGDPVLAIGSPYGLTGTVTSGIVSALGRTITEATTAGYVIADCVQTTTPINPGNSGGPLLNLEGEVVGITTAIVTSSVGLGFAIPSNTILREIQSLIASGSYSNHPALGAYGTDMNYQIAQAMGTNVTYGWLLTQVTSGGAAAKAGLKGSTTQTQIEGTTVAIGGDIVIAINGTRIKNIDDLSAYLEENTLPDQTIEVTIVRGAQTLTLPVQLQARAPAST